MWKSIIILYLILQAEGQIYLETDSQHNQAIEFDYYVACFELSEFKLFTYDNLLLHYVSQFQDSTMAQQSVFTEHVVQCQQRLPREVKEKLKNTIKSNERIDFQSYLDAYGFIYEGLAMKLLTQKIHTPTDDDIYINQLYKKYIRFRGGLEQKQKLDQEEECNVCELKRLSKQNTYIEQVRTFKEKKQIVYISITGLLAFGLCINFYYFIAYIVYLKSVVIKKKKK